MDQETKEDQSSQQAGNAPVSISTPPSEPLTHEPAITAPSPVQPAKKKFPALIVVVIIVLLVACAAAAYFLVFNAKKQPDNKTVEPVTTTETQTTQKVNPCLVNSDFEAIWKEKFGPNEPFSTSINFAQNGMSDNVHFNPDSLEFTDEGAEGYVIPYAHFARDRKDKNFTIEMYGSVGTDNQSDLSFADQRVAKVKQIYLDNGGLESKVKVISSQTVLKNVDGTYDSIDQGTSRVVVFRIVPQPNCSADGQSGQ